MNFINEDALNNSKESGVNSCSEIVSVERGNIRSNSSITNVVSTINLFTNRMCMSGSGQTHFDFQKSKEGKKIKKLRNQLEDIINETLYFPIEMLENTLYELTQEYFKEGNWRKPILSTFATMYPIQKLIEKDDINSDKWSILLEKYIDFNPNAFLEMKFFKKFIQFINDLCIIWDITNIYNYRSRFNPLLEMADFLDLDGFFSNIISNEVIWLSIISNSYPMSEVLDDNIKRLALLLQNQINDLFDKFINANKPHISKCENIQPWLSYKNPKLVTEFSFLPPNKDLKPDYQHLKYSWTNAVLRKKIYNLRKELESFEYCYRTFESAFIQSVVELINYEC